MQMGGGALLSAREKPRAGARETERRDPMPNLTDISTIRDLCARYDFALSKGFGQNFIVNPGICPKIVEAAGIDKSWGVIEVGPGVGVLTK